MSYGFKIARQINNCVNNHKDTHSNSWEESEAIRSLIDQHGEQGPEYKIAFLEHYLPTMNEESKERAQRTLEALRNGGFLNTKPNGRAL